MCVTNNVRRAPRALAVENPSAIISKTPSLLSQRLVGNFMPLMMNATNNAGASVPATSQFCVQQGMHASKLESKKPRRRRKPQKPGKTAKLNDRHFVVHNYHDHAFDAPENDYVEESSTRRRGGVSMSFPLKLHAILDQVEADGLADVISWQPHGRCFVIHNPKEFTEYVMPRYFRQSKLTSFQRQLNLYGFSRLTTGKDTGGYYHELFLRGKLFLAKRMSRTKVKGTKFKAASSPEHEPDFYTMPPVTTTMVTPNTTSDEDSSSDEGTYTSPVMTSIAPALNEASASMLEPIPLFSQTVTQKPSMRVTNNVWETPSQQNLNNTDSLFDAAIDEVFFDEDPMAVENDFNNIWDPSMEVTQKIEDDAQLGFLLEQMLQQS